MTESVLEPISAHEWWGHRRLRYNLALLVAACLAFACHLVVALWAERALVWPYETPRPALAVVDTWLWPAAVGLVILLIVANVAYFLGPLGEFLVPGRFVSLYRRFTFPLGLWLSVLVPFVIPAVFGAFVALGVLAGYGSPVASADVPGSYVADYGPAVDTVTLREDGRFAQTTRVRSTGKVYTAGRNLVL